VTLQAKERFLERTSDPDKLPQRVNDALRQSHVIWQSRIFPVKLNCPLGHLVVRVPTGFAARKKLFPELALDNLRSPGRFLRLRNDFCELLNGSVQPFAPGDGTFSTLFMPCATQRTCNNAAIILDLISKRNSTTKLIN